MEAVILLTPEDLIGQLENYEYIEDDFGAVIEIRYSEESRQRPTEVFNDAWYNFRN
jgi:hypothetical protein